MCRIIMRDGEFEAVGVVGVLADDDDDEAEETAAAAAAAVAAGELLDALVPF